MLGRNVEINIICVFHANNFLFVGQLLVLVNGRSEPQPWTLMNLCTKMPSKLPHRWHQKSLVLGPQIASKKMRWSKVVCFMLALAIGCFLVRNIFTGGKVHIHNLFICLFYTEFCCNIQRHKQKYPFEVPNPLPLEGANAPSQMGHNKSGEAVSANLLISCRIWTINKLWRMCFFLANIPREVMVLQNAWNIPNGEGVSIEFLYRSQQLECFCWNQIPNFSLQHWWEWWGGFFFLIFSTKKHS